jgi:hypothetical protein
VKISGKLKVIFRGKGNGKGNISSKVADNSKGEGKLTVRVNGKDNRESSAVRQRNGGGEGEGEIKGLNNCKYERKYHDSTRCMMSNIFLDCEKISIRCPALFSLCVSFINTRNLTESWGSVSVIVVFILILTC